MTDYKPVRGPARKTRDGKKFDTWEVHLPDDTKASVEVYVCRGDENTYRFHAKPPFEDAQDLWADSPEELNELVNAAVEKDIQARWDKCLLVECQTYSNERTDPEDPGTHELSFEWHVCWKKKVANRILYVHDGETFPRDFGHRREASCFLPWTQNREDSLRQLGQLVHEANNRLVKLLRDDGLAKLLDGGGRLLGP